MSLLMLDSRWKRFNDEARACPCCGVQFNGIFDIGFSEPEDWPHAPYTGAPVEVEDDVLTSDYCRIDGRHFLRAVLLLPVRGADDNFGFGAWVEVSRDVARAYGETFGDDPQPFEGEGLLANTLPGFEDEQGIAVALTCPDPAERALIHPLDGPLAEALENGISFDDLLDIYAASGNDIRPHLTQ
ncbi:DUF2199 domain-containing protein [Tropicibacter naphthalenivorans]|uniref:DUF2199 domain-containing protein n=1 Tax=Tropicibacter naphthalenivorans TaxID=441103 RepID=A0A0P1G5G2_9RHOB|nr:DUF2199 domain-containing protein [Tropicibacter naphthalenivorans]CUH76995.1 hypothetical protein TRN7648_01235 [Tropicibacter naphthalenivorans]SMC61730.1 hypothetical protein SAMN04488093_102383 [Tropicibacter naphthalenivorans]